MILIRAIAFLLHFTLVPVAVGRLITYRSKELQHRSPIVTYVIGLFGSWGVFYLLNSIFVWYQNSTMIHEVVRGGFHRLVITYSVLMAIAVIAWIFLELHNHTPFKSEITGRFAAIKKQFIEDKFLAVYVLIFTVLLVGQMYVAFKYEINEWSYDDYDYVVTSLDNIDSDMISNVNFITGESPYTSTKRIANSWNTYVSYLAQVSGFEVTTVCHTILNVVLLLVAYGIYFYMARFLFQEADNRMIFMILLSMAFIFGYYSHYSPTFRLLCAIWQGKAVLTAIAVPFMICYMARLFAEKPDTSAAIGLAMFSLGASSLTNLSILLIPLTTVVMFVVMTIHNKKPLGFRYVVASLFGPAYQLAFYLCAMMLLNKQLGPNFIDIWRG
ncbi:MAG: hypothetical protein K6E79_06380 [Pseudobutyrivibrio sp.]|nr:hypothetical protein [Pseudobutyrivibrio sp.]